MTATRFSFRGCTVDAARRELHVDGELRPLEPRPFDLLVYLLQNRHRTVPSDELLDRLWPNAFVSSASVARAVAIVRKALHADGTPLSPIRTVHRVGYRIDGEVFEGPAAPKASDLPDPPLAVVAVLPFENFSGNPSLDWITLFLMSQVCHALALDTRLSPLSMHRLADGLVGLEQSAPEMRAMAVRERCGADHVVQARLTGSAPRYQLAYRLLTGDQHASGSVEGETPVALGRQLARRLLTQLAPAAASAPEAEGDPWIDRLFDRLMHKLLRSEWLRAQHLLDVILEESPGNTTALRLSKLLAEYAPKNQVRPAAAEDQVA